MRELLSRCWGDPRRLHQHPRKRPSVHPQNRQPGEGVLVWFFVLGGAGAPAELGAPTLLIFETGSHWVAQAGLGFAILWQKPPQR